MTWRACLSVLAVSFVCTALVGCGEDKGQDGHTHDDAGNGHAHHDAGNGHDHHDAGDEDLIKQCRDDLPPFEPGLEQLGTDGLIRARLVSAEPSALRKGANDIVFDFLSEGGEPVTDLTVKRAWTYMPIHDHDGTFMPEDSPEQEAGRVRFTSFHFSMRGPWQIRLELESPAVGDDVVVIEVCVGK